MSRIGIAGVLAMIALAVAAPMASGAEFGIVPGSLSIKTLDDEGNPDNRAGAHPDRLLIEFSLTTDGTGTSPRDLIFELLLGLGGNSNAIPECQRNELEENEEGCPEESQVGVFRLTLFESVETQKIYNLEPAPTEVAAFASGPFKAPFSIQLRSDGYGSIIAMREMVGLPVTHGEIELWGVPLDHQEEKVSPRRALLTSPTRCGPTTVTLNARSWQEGAPWLSETANGAPLSGCQGLPFEPHAELKLTNPVADSPTGVQVDLQVPQNEDPDGLASSQLKEVSIALPDGMSLSAAGANGLTACSDAQFGLDATTQAACPFASKIGTVGLEAPQMQKPLDGTIYIGEERPGDRFRLFVVAANPALEVKLVGSLHADPVTGQLTVTLRDLPQVSFSRMSLNIDGGPRALLAGPLSCGRSIAIVTFEPYSGGPPVDSSAPLEIGANPAGSQCSAPLPFAPTLVAGGSTVDAGRPTSFSVTLERRDGEQLASRFSVTLPPGLTAAVGATELCPDSGAAAGVCPAGSRIGSAAAELGSGPAPAVLTGDVYLTGPYRRAPFGLSLVFPAMIGPFDLGTVVVRARLRIDRLTGQITVETDPLPQTIEGVPTRFRTVGIDMNQGGFIRNPTSCEPTSISAAIHAVGGVSAASMTPFALKGCNALRFRPAFFMRLTGSSHLGRGSNPGMRVTTRLSGEGANLRALNLWFPPLLRFDGSGLKEICAREDAMDGLCLSDAQVGSGYARTPLLSEPLKGPIYVVQPTDDGLPDLWISLGGMGVNLDIVGESSVRDGRLAIKLRNLPDMPLSSFTMRFRSGDEGVLSLDADPCNGNPPGGLVTRAGARGHNGAFRQLRVPVTVKTGCSGGSSEAYARPAERRAVRRG